MQLKQMMERQKREKDNAARMNLMGSAVEKQRKEKEEREKRAKADAERARRESEVESEAAAYARQKEKYKDWPVNPKTGKRSLLLEGARHPVWAPAPPPPAPPPIMRQGSMGSMASMGAHMPRGPPPSWPPPGRRRRRRPLPSRRRRRINAIGTCDPAIETGTGTFATAAAVTVDPAGGRSREPAALRERGDELPKDIDGGLIWVSRREGIDEAYAKKLIGMASDGGMVFQKWITSPNTVIFLCDVSKNDDGHQILLDVFRAQPREGAGERRMYREELGDQPLDPTAFLSSKPDGLPHQVKLVPWQMGSRPGKIGTIQRGRSSILRDTNFRDWLSLDLRKKIRDGKDEFPVILTKHMAEELALGLIKEGREQDKRKSRRPGNGGYK